MKNKDYNPDFHVIKSKIDEQGVFHGETESGGTITLMPVAALNDTEMIGGGIGEILKQELPSKEVEQQSAQIEDWITYDEWKKRNEMMSKFGLPCFKIPLIAPYDGK